MENRSLQILEFDKILKIMAEYTQSEAVRKRIFALAPVSSVEQATRLQAETTEALRMLIKQSPPALSAPDISGFIKRCEVGGVLLPHELLSIARVLSMARNAKRYLSAADPDSFPILSAISKSITPVKSIEDEIERCILSEEEIADAASSELASIRRKIRGLQGKIKEMLDSITRSSKASKYLQDPIVTMRSGRYVIPVKAEYRSEVAGVVHDTSASGATVFIEPMSVVNANNEIRDLVGREEAEIERILAMLSAKVSERAHEILTNYVQLCELDFIFCKGRLSLKFSCSEPVLNDTGEIF